MDKHIWKPVKTLSSTSHKPSSRWGHSSCVVGEDIVFFGGYADSVYMNDLWAFNSVTMKWRQIETYGDVPVQRSNCSMNYDKENDQIIIFGGGGANKQRFNSVSILDWKTKQWMQINPKENEVAPWERTYHVAELINPYLVVFGGQGVADLDDLWIFSFITLSWTEVKFPSDKVKPCARRFHSSVLIGNEFMVLAGCHSKYRCLSDVFSLDLTSLLKTGKFDQLEWTQKKLKNSSFLTRWGHSSAVYDNKIYIFGGRFSNDLNDLLVADFETNSIKQIKTNVQAPQARRRHCAGFIGSSMLVFGGFNGQYFQDLYYISVHQPKSKFQISTVFDELKLNKFINNKIHSDYRIKTKDDSDFHINIGMITNLFESEIDLGQFLQSVHYEYTKQELQSIFPSLYSGYGETQLREQHLQKLKFALKKSKNEKISSEREKIDKNSSENGERKIIKKVMQVNNPIIKLPQEDFTDYYVQNKQKGFWDYELMIGSQSFLINRIKVISKSDYFLNLFQKSSPNRQIKIPNILQETSKTIYEIFFSFLATDWLVMNDNSSIETYMELSYLADYFCVPVLLQICTNELLNMIATENVEKIMHYSINMKQVNLTKSCCDFWIKKISEIIKFSQMKNQITKNFGNRALLLKNVQQTYAALGFDIAQNMMESQKSVPSFMKKTQSTNSIQKQNFETNVYNH